MRRAVVCYISGMNVGWYTITSNVWLEAQREAMREKNLRINVLMTTARQMRGSSVWFCVFFRR